MIEIKNLSKKYSSKNGVDCLALDNLSFVLPDNGMIFVTGKSGSGKSTFLNIIGGLDNATSGTFMIDGNEITALNEQQLEDYRNTYLGFIFQEFFLIDSLTVFENIKLTLDLLEIKDDEIVYKTIERVGLKCFENKYPRQLSGGEKQRVAIARALVKKPRLLLADELTGNLDEENAKIVLDLLQELSKELLVIVVSHHIDDANFYATRKIELSDGKVISDVEKTYSIDTPLITDSCINMPYHRKLTKEEVLKVNEVLPLGGYEFRQLQDGFTTTNEVTYKVEKVNFVSSKLSLKNTFKYGLKFSKGNILNSITSVVLFTILLVLLFVCHIFEFTDVNYLTAEAHGINQNDTHILVKANFPTNSKFYIEPTHMMEVTEEDIKEFYNLGYEGNVYKIYGDALAYGNSNSGTSTDQAIRKVYSISELPYVPFGNQTFECDLDLLTKLYGDSNGKLNVLAGSLDEDYKEFGYIITDYAADCIMHNWIPYNGLSKEEVYEKIVTDGYFYRNFTVKAIIDTDYEMKYKDVLSLCSQIEDSNDDAVKKNLTSQLQQLPLTADFLEEITSYYSSAYFVNSKMSFYEAFFHEDNPNVVKNLKNKNTIITSNNSVLSTGVFSFVTKEDLAKGEIEIPYELYNKWFGTSYTKENYKVFTPCEIIINTYAPFDLTYKNLGNQKSFTISSLTTGTNLSSINISREDLKDLASTMLFPSGVCFDNTESILKNYVPNSLEFKPFISLNSVYDAAYEVNEVISIVRDIFLFVIIGVSIVASILLINYTNRTINRKKREVGIYKAIGGKSKQFRNFFIIQLGLLWLTIVLLSALIIALFSNTLNEIFVDALAIGLKKEKVKEFIIIRFEFILLALYYLILLALIVVTSILSIKSFKKIKPLNIIRNTR